MSESYLKTFKNYSTIFNYLKILLISLRNNSFNIKTVLNNSSIQKIHELEISTVEEFSELLTYYNFSLNTNNDNNSDNINNLKILDINNFSHNNLDANILLFNIFSFSADLI